MKAKGITVNCSMFIDPAHPRYIKVPALFSENAKYKYAFKAISMGMTDAMFDRFVAEGMTSEELKTLIAEVTKAVLGRMATLEKEHQMRLSTKVKSPDCMFGLGRRFLRLYNKMEENLGNNRAARLMDKHTGYEKLCKGENIQSHLGDCMVQNKKVNSYLGGGKQD